METREPTVQLLKGKYDLHNSPEVKTSAIRAGLRSQDPLVRIQYYLDRLNNIINPPQLEGHPRFDRKGRNITLLKNGLYDRFVIKPDEIPEGYWENQMRIIRERGQAGDLEQADWQELRRQNTEAVIADQKSSLDKWVNYLASPDSSWVPNPLKYYALRSILNMSEYDKEKKVYPQRSKGTTKPFPDLNREALAYVLDALDKKYRGQRQHDVEFEKLLQGENFAKLYAWAIEKVTPASAEQLMATAGRWVKYDQGSDHVSLVQSLQGHGTGWCTAGESTAQAQLRSGDFYVYYSFDKEGKPTVPRVAIRMEGSKIAEVRGIAADQNLDSGVTPVVEGKLREFPDGELYQKRVRDMALLTAIEHKAQQGQSLTREELIFLYEADTPIEGFGYSRDPRIAELRSTRNPEQDMPIVFGCSIDQIAHRLSEIHRNTKAYVGKLESGLFDRLPSTVEYIYTSFPERKIRKQDLEIGGRTASELESQLKARGIQISSWAESMLRSRDFQTLKRAERITTVKLTVQDLGFDDWTRTSQLFERVHTLGLELCPAETAAYMRLADMNQPNGDWYYIGMKPLADADGYPYVFRLERGEGRLWLSSDWADPDYEWTPEDVFVFRLRK